MNLHNPPESKFGAFIFIVLACLIFLSSFLLINSPAPALIISFFLMSIILMLMGLQRLNRTKISELKFTKTVKFLGSLALITSCMAIFLNSAISSI